MKVFVVLLAVIGTALCNYYQNILGMTSNIKTNEIFCSAARLHGSVDKTPNGLAALLAEKGGLRIGEVGTRIVGGGFYRIIKVNFRKTLTRLRFWFLLQAKLRQLQTFLTSLLCK